MKNNLITIDLEKLKTNHLDGFKELVKDAVVETPCTLTDVIKRFSEIKIGDIDIDNISFTLICRS